MILHFKDYGPDEYARFLAAKRIPEFEIVTAPPRADDGTWPPPLPVACGISFADKFAHFVGAQVTAGANIWQPLAAHLFDDQRAIVRMALDGERFAIWKDCGLGKTAEQLEWARQVAWMTGGRVLIVTMNEVVPQTVDEWRKFYGPGLALEPQIIESRAAMREWCLGDGIAIGITNYEKFNPDEEGQIVPEIKHLAGICLDESSRLKAGGGKQKWAVITSSKGVRFKLSCTATPAPNDVMEFASQASFLERMRSENEIIWTWFTRHPKTQEWTVKPHARPHFFRWMATWSIYVRDPKSYGWRIGMTDVPEPITLTHEVNETQAQTELRMAATAAVSVTGMGDLFGDKRQGMVTQGKLMQASRGFLYESDNDERGAKRVASRKPGKVAALVADALERGKQVLCWVEFNEEGKIIGELLSANGVEGCVVLDGRTPKKLRAGILEDFRHGRIRCLIAKGRMLGYGLNFQCCTCMVHSGISDSFEDFYQRVRRAVRYGQTEAVENHLVIVPELEGPIYRNLMDKQAAWLRTISEMESAYVLALKELSPPGALPAPATHSVVMVNTRQVEFPPESPPSGGGAGRRKPSKKKCA